METGPQLTVTATAQQWQMLSPGHTHTLDNVDGDDPVYYVPHARSEESADISGTDSGLLATARVSRLRAGGRVVLDANIHSVSIVRGSDASGNVVVTQAVGGQY